MARLVHILHHVFLSLVAQNTIRVSQAEMTKCDFHVGWPNDTVFCRGYSSENLSCTNAECCINEGTGCFNMSVIQAYGIWQPPPETKVCTRGYYTIHQTNNTNKAIYGRIIVQHDVISIGQCFDFCLRQPRCRSFNVAHASKEMRKRSCELFEEEQNIVQRKGFSFWLFDRESYRQAFLSPYCHADK